MEDKMHIPFIFLILSTTKSNTLRGCYRKEKLQEYDSGSHSTTD